MLKISMEGLMRDSLVSVGLALYRSGGALRLHPARGEIAEYRRLSRQPTYPAARAPTRGRAVERVARGIVPGSEPTGAGSRDAVVVGRLFRLKYAD